VLLIFALSRVVTTVIMVAFAHAQGATYWAGPHPDYFHFAGFWDSAWYYQIAEFGYPSHLPHGSDGYVAENSWAFLPGFALVLRVVSWFGVPLPIAGVVVATAFGAGATLLLYRILVRVLPAETALFAVVLFCVGTTAPVLQVGYAESMQLFFLFWFLVLLQRRRYYLMIPVILVAAFTRPSGLAIAVTLFFHLIYRFVTRTRDPFPTRERIAVVVAGVASAVFGVAWTLIAWIGTGSFSAYTDSELAWRTAFIGHQVLVPFEPWFQGAQWWLSYFGVPAAAVLSVVLVVVMVVVFVVLLFTPAVRRLGADLRLWLAGYVVYLLAVFFPQSSTFRLLMPLAPALGVIAIPRSKIYRVALVVLAIGTQVLWIAVAWYYIGPEWTPP
jgi:hypothetical protein